MSATKQADELSEAQCDALDEIDESEHPRDFPVDHEGDNWPETEIIGSDTGDLWWKWVEPSNDVHGRIKIKNEDTCDQIEWQ